MKCKHAGLALAVAAVLSVPAFAQTAAGSTNDINANNSSNNGTNVAIPSSPNSNGGTAGARPSVTVMPSTSVALPSAHLMPGGTMSPAQSTTVLGGPSGDVSGTQSVTTRYWVNVPANAQTDPSFQRWQALR